ncbi:MAG: GNAT family N-acetyltransferase [Bacteroidia bacterium]
MIIRTDSHHEDFIELVNELDKELAIKDGAEHSFYNQFNKIDSLKHVVVFYQNQEPICCGAFKIIDSNTVEIKRMFTKLDYRSKGFGQTVLNELEIWAAEIGCKFCILETGKKQPDAIALYKKAGYEIITNYGQYIGITNSVCFKKQVK